MERIDANQNHQGSTVQNLFNRSTCRWIRRNGRMITYVVTVLEMLKSLPLSRFDAVNLCFFSVFKLIIIYFPESWSMHIRCTTVWFYILNHVWPVGSCWNSSNPHAVQSAPMLQVAAQTAVARGNGMQQVEKPFFWGEKRGEKMSKDSTQNIALHCAPWDIFRSTNNGLGIRLCPWQAWARHAADGLFQVKIFRISVLGRNHGRWTLINYGILWLWTQRREP